VDYSFLMQQALQQARDAASNGDIPVGALIVNDYGQVFGSGKNERIQGSDPLAHAEIMAIKDAAKNISNWRFDQLTIIVTLEPCAMCAGAIAQSRFKRLVFGAFDQKAGAVGSVWDLIRDVRALTHIEVISGVLADHSALLLSDFFKEKR
jgi:tRNA(adenine34) deaminase